MSVRPYYDRAYKALKAANDACFEHSDRDVLAMSRGPFSGVNEALEIIMELEKLIKRQSSVIIMLMSFIENSVGDKNNGNNPIPH